MSDKTVINTMAVDLATILGAVCPFAADPEYGIPVIAGVQLHAGEGMLTATATDRYVLGYARKNALAERAVRFILDVRDARQVRNALSREMKTRRSGQIPVILTVTEGDKREITVDFEPRSMTFREVDGAKNAPDLSNSIAGLVKPGATPEPGPVGINARALEPFIKASRWAEHQPLRWTLGEGMKPIRVEIDDWFLGLVMPVRLKDDVPAVEYTTPAMEKADTEAVSA